MNKTKLFLILALSAFLSCTPEPLVSELSPETPESGSGPIAFMTPEEKLTGWVASMQMENGLVESAEDTDFVSLYDNALASLLFMVSGEKRRAQLLLDYFHSKREEEFAVSGGGFYQFRNTEGLDRSRVWLGDNLWLLLAMQHYQERYAETRYDPTIQALQTWVRSLQDSDGGLWGGYEQDGRQIPKVTEGMLTAYLAIPGFDSFHENMAAYLLTNRWNEDSSTLMAEDEPGPYAHALDLHSLPALIWPGSGLHFLLSADRFFTVQQHQVHQWSVSGYCFDEDQDVVWLEGSAQMALAFRVHGEDGQYDASLQNLEKSLLPSGKDSHLEGLPYAANHGSSFGAVPLWDHADETPAVSSTAWYYFALRGFNPLALEGQKPVLQ